MMVKNVILSALLALATAVTACKKEGFVRVSDSHNAYFALDNGETYIPNGLNFCCPT